MMLTLDEAIQHCLECAERNEKIVDAYKNSLGIDVGCRERAEEYRQLASCLKTLKEIWDSGSCNDCKFNGHCEIQPKLGQLVRFNCYHFSRVANGEENADVDSD